MTDLIDPKVQLYVKLPISRFNRLQNHARACGTTMAEFVRVAIEEKMMRDRVRVAEEVEADARRQGAVA